MAEETKDESLEEGKAASNLNLKGIDTVTGSAEELIEKEKLSPIIDDGNGDDDKKKKKRKKKKLSNPLFRSADLYQQPTTEKEKFLADLSSAASSPASPEVLGTDFTFDKDAFDFLKAQFTPIDLSNGIPDPIEREAFKEEHKNKIVQLLDPNKIGIRFENQLEDLATFRKLAYDKNLKKFLDDLDENQAWYETTFNNLIKLPLDIALGVGSLIPLAYGMGKALFNGDSKYIFDNGGFDLLEDTQHYIDKKFVVYGGADYTQGDKNFFARFKDNPGKMLNQEVIPLLGFVGSAVATELVAGALAVPTGGASLLAGGARITARTQQLFSKSVNVIRGLDVLDDVNKMNKIANLTTKWRRGYGTAIQMMRSSGYESSLIARDTEKNTKELSKLNYINANPKLRTQYENLIRQNSDPFGNLLISHEAILDQVSIPKNILKRIDFNAAQASRLAYWSNVPLVGFSNLIQFSKTFNTSYRLGQKITGQGAKLNPLRGVKYAKDTATGKVTAFAAADKAGKIKKVLGWGMVAGKGFATEAFEEFSQGVFEKGYSDYYSAPFTNKSLRRTKDFFSTMTNSARNYYNSVEGQDSIWLGGLAGMFGIPLYGKIDTKTGKLQRGWQWYGGAYQEIKEVKERIEKDRKRAKQYNETPINPIAKNNFENYIREQQFQDEMDQAQKEGNKHEYQNAKYKSTHAFVTNRIKNGIENTIFQDLDSLDKMDLKTFNDNYGWKGFEFTAEQKKDAIEDTRSVVKNIIEAHKKTENLFADRRIWIDKFFDKHYKGIEDPFYLLEGVKDQMAFLLGSIGDYKKREKELSSLISELTNGSINPKQFDRILAKYSGIKKRGYTVKKGDSWESIAKQHNTTPEYLKAQNKEGLKEGERIYIDQEYGFIDNAREFYTETLEEFKENNPVDFKLNEIALKEALQDLILIKLAKAKAANIYSTLSSNKKTKEFVDLLTQLNKGRIEQLENLVEEENEEKITKSRGENAVKKVQLDTSNTQKGNPIVTGKVNEEVEKIINDIEQLRKTGEDITIDYIIDQLHKSPGFTVQIIDSLGENSLGVLNSVDIDNLISSQEHPMFVARIKNAFNKLIDQYSTINQEKGSRNKQHQHVPTVDSAQNLSSKYAHLSPKNKDAKEYEKLPVTPVSMILSTFHKKLEKKGGKWVPIPTDKGYLDSTIDQGINLDLIIKPDFLNNQELQSENIQVNFKYSETDKYAEDDPYQRVIDVLHKGEKIGELPGWVDGRPEHLKVLREVIASEAAQEAVGEELGDAYAGYEATILSKKETISKEEYEHFVDTGEVSNDIINLLAEKYKEGKQDTFTLQEKAIFDNKTKEINQRLEEIAKTETKEDSLVDKLKAEEERQTLLDKIKPDSLTKKERKLIIAKALLKGKSLKEAQKEAGYVEVQGIMISPDAPIEMLKIVDQVIWDTLVAKGISYIETSDSDGHGSALSRVKNGKAYAWGIDLSKGLIDFFKEKSKDFPEDTELRVNHVLAHELGHKVWQNDLTDAQKQIVENTEEKAEYVKRLEEGTVTSGAGLVEENFTENFAWDLTQKLIGRSERSVFTELQELMNDINSKTETKETTTSDIKARKKKLGINKNVLRIDSVGTTGSMSTKVRIQTPDGGILIIKPGTDSDLNFERVAPKGMYTRKNNDPYDVVTLQDNFDKINEKENLIPQKLVDILIKEADFKGKKQTLENPQYTDIQKKIFAVSDKANITLTPDYGPTKEYREEILDPLSEFTDLFLKEIYESEIEKHKGYIADIKKKGDESEKKQISTREEYIAVYENELAALEQTTSPETEVEQSDREKII